MKAKLIVFCAAAALLSACGDEPVAEVAEEKATAQGEILEGTISDDMLPLESLKSQAPRADGKANEDSAASEGEGE